MKLHFYKYHGAGNDFIIINNLKKEITLSQEQIKFLCDRHFGIGADGFMELLPSENYDFAMKYYNADGAEGTMCGNGGRCIVAFASMQNIIKTTTTFEAIDGIHKATLHSRDDIELKMNDVNNYEIRKNKFIVDTGSPHIVIFTKEIDNIDVYNEGRKIRYSKEFPQGINVNFAEIKDEKIFMRTYERGVENETLACGTGTVATAIAANILHKVEPPVNITARGGNLSVSFRKIENKFTDIWLRGPAKFVFEGDTLL
jgi:diaminopimelate epimerase